jgi:branched-chain amino acid transport system substrate-binding protein
MKKQNSITRRDTLALGASALAVAALPAAAQTSGAPVRIGSTLALTGPLAATGAIHKIVGEIFISEANKKQGLLGRPIEWVLLDDQSKPDLARTLYERLITSDKVDLIVGPYATANILSAMSVAQRYNKMLVHSTFGVPKLATYERHFPAWPIGFSPEETNNNMVADAIAASGKPVKTVAIVTSKFPSLHFLSLGAREVFKKRGYTEALFLEFEFGTRDFGPIAARIREANPDLLYMGAIGLEANQLLEALEKINYTPKNHLYLYPSPGPLAQSPLGKDAMSLTIYEDLPPFSNNPEAATFAKLYREAATKAGFPFVDPETQAGASYSMWQILSEAVNTTKSLDDNVLTAHLKKNGASTIVGKVRFDGPQNYGDDLMRLKQVQDGKWAVVWPKDVATPGKSLIVK